MVSALDSVANAVRVFYGRYETLTREGFHDIVASNIFRTVSSFMITSTSATHDSIVGITRG